MKALIISSGTITDYCRLEWLLKDSDFVICADGGMNHLVNVNTLPNLVIGDLDSIKKEALDLIKYNNIPIEKYSTVKDTTDTGLALEYLIEGKYNEITMIGVTGTRQDHTTANIFLLDYLNKKGIKGRIVDDNNIIYLIDDYIELDYVVDSYVSIIPITDGGITVSLSGFYYNLNNTEIEFGSTYGISNRIVEKKGRISIHKGKALIFISKD